jgi:hypothetical protein
LLPTTRANYTSTGSRNTCIENATWFVLTAPEPMSHEQAHAFGRIFPRDSRPTQPLNGILVPSVAASQVFVTPDDRSVIYISIISGAVSIGCTPQELTRRRFPGGNG